MSHLLTRRSTTHPSLAPRIIKPLLLTLGSTGKSRGSRGGTIRGLVNVDRHDSKGVIEGRGAKGVAWESRISGYSLLTEP